MLVRKNFKRDEVLLKVKNRLEDSNLELRLRLMRHEVERRKDWLKREMGQILECQEQCKKSSGDSIAIYRDLVLNSRFRYAPVPDSVVLPNNRDILSDTKLTNQKDSDTNFRWKKLQNDNTPKVKIATVKQTKIPPKPVVPLPKIGNSKDEMSSAHSLKMKKVTQTILTNGRGKSFHEPSHDTDKDRSEPKLLPNPNRLSNLLSRPNLDDGKNHLETFSGKLKLPKIVTTSTSSPPPEARKTLASNDKNDTGSSGTKNSLSTLHLLAKETTESGQTPRENVTKKVSTVPKPTIEKSKWSKSFKLPVMNDSFKSNSNIQERNWKKRQTKDSRGMTDIVARIASELKLESTSPFFANLALSDGGSGKTKHSGSGAKTNIDPSDPNDFSGPPNRLIQKGRFLPEHMSNSDMSDDSKSQSSADSPYILYKGRKLRNYVRPQDRFRVDQITRTWKKQQLFLKLLKNRPDDLTKCSLRWDPALGDSDSLQLSQPARKKVLERMVEENMSRPAPTRPETDHTELNSRVKEFMDSLGNNPDAFFL